MWSNIVVLANYVSLVRLSTFSGEFQKQDGRFGGVPEEDVNDLVWCPQTSKTLRPGLEQRARLNPFPFSGFNTNKKNAAKTP